MPADTIREKTFCCGAGGGLLTDELMPIRMAGGKPRAMAVKHVRANYLATICAICKAQLPESMHYWDVAGQGRRRDPAAGQRPEAVVRGGARFVETRMRKLVLICGRGAAGRRRDPGLSIVPWRRRPKTARPFGDHVGSACALRRSITARCIGGRRITWMCSTAATWRRADCLYCHEPETSCNNCHAYVGVKEIVK